MADKLQAIIDRLEPAIAAAFRASIDNITSAAQLKMVIGHIEAGNIEAAIVALNLRPEFFAPLDNAMRAAYIEGGASMLAGLPALETTFSLGTAVAVRFDGRHLRAERVAREISGKLITRIVADQRDAVRVVVETGIREGWNPRKTALDIVGRINRATGNREGGIVGLNKPQAEAVLRARAELADLSPDYFARKLRDKRFDRTVRKAVDSGEKIAAADMDRITQGYSRRLLKHRGDTIARTETIGSLNAGREEGIRQIIDSGAVRADQATMVWDASGDGKVRDSHQSMDSQRRPVGVPFTTPTGYQLRWPGDGELGAPASETVNCRCLVRADISFIKGLR